MNDREIIEDIIKSIRQDWKRFQDSDTEEFILDKKQANALSNIVEFRLYTGIIGHTQIQ